MTFFMSGQEIFDNFQQGAGAEGISFSAGVVNQLAHQHRERYERLQQLKARMEQAWQGEAAGAARRGLGPLVIEHDLSGNALHTAQDLTGRQAGSFGEAKNKVVPVPPEPGEVDPLAVLTSHDAMATYLVQVSEHKQAAQHNVDVMNGYTGASQYNTDGQPTTFGELVDDQAGVSVGSLDAVIPDDTRESTSDSGSHGSAPWPGSGGGPGYRPPSGDDGRSGVRPDTSAGPGTRSDTSAGTPPGMTTPGSYTVTPSPAGPVSLSPSADAGVGQPRPAPGGGIVPGVGVGFPGDGRSPGSSGGGQRAGLVGGAPRVGGGVGGPGGGAGVGAGQPGAAGRAGPGAAATGPGRGGAGFGGLPVGAGGRGRGEEDTERKAPEYLEGGDPDELFGTDLLTAPPAIGDENEDD